MYTQFYVAIREERRCGRAGCSAFLYPNQIKCSGCEFDCLTPGCKAGTYGKNTYCRYCRCEVGGWGKCNNPNTLPKCNYKLSIKTMSCKEHNRKGAICLLILRNRGVLLEKLDRNVVRMIAKMIMEI